MQIKKLGNLIAYSLVASAILVGCSSSDSDSSSGTNVEVERGKVYDANVTDAAGHKATVQVGSNIYTFGVTPTYPITVSGGWIDVDGDGNMTTADITLDINMTSYSNIVTPITTYISDSNKTIREQKMAQLMNDMNISESELLKVPSKANATAILLANAIYEKAKEAHTTNMSNITFNDLNTTFTSLKTFYEQSCQNMKGVELAKAIENQVVNTDLAGLVTKLDQAKIDEIKAQRDDKNTSATTFAYNNEQQIIMFKDTNKTEAEVKTQLATNFAGTISKVYTETGSCTSIDNFKNLTLQDSNITGYKYVDVNASHYCYELNENTGSNNYIIVY